MVSTRVNRSRFTGGTRRTAYALCAAIVMFASGVVGTASAESGDAPAEVRLAPEIEPLARGVDSSNWQHPHGSHPNWGTTAESGKSFAFVKATEGIAPMNEHYESDVAAARAAGMAVGSYHKARPATDPVAQARAFATRIQSVGGPQLPPALDIEIDEGLGPDELADWVRTFLHETEAATGRTPIVYTYPHFWREALADTTEFSGYPLWIAEYRVSEPSRPLVGGWSEWLFWQRLGDDGRNAGFDGPVDLNVFAGDVAGLSDWLGPVAPAPEPKADPKAAPVAAPVADESGPTEVIEVATDTFEQVAARTERSDGTDGRDTEGASTGGGDDSPSLVERPKPVEGE